MRLGVIALLAVFCACKKEGPRAVLGPVSVVVPEGFVEDAARAAQLGSRTPLDNQAKVWVDKQSKLQVAITLARLPHQPEWDKVSNTVLLTEMVTQEIAAGEKANLKTVKWDRKFEGPALHYTLEGDMGGQLGTANHTALWVDAKGDCWHASAVCTSPPVDRPKCVEIVATVRFDVDAGVAP